MTDFEYLFALFGLLFGLIVAEVALRFADAIDRHRVRPMGILTPALALLVLTDMTTYWMFLWGYRASLHVSYTTVFSGVLLAMVYFLTASLVFPREGTECGHLDEHYFRRKRMVAGGILFVNVIVIGAMLTRTMPEWNDWWFYYYFPSYVVALAGLVISRSRRLDLALIALALSVNLTSGFDLLPHSRFGQTTGIVPHTISPETGGSPSRPARARQSAMTGLNSDERDCVDRAVAAQAAMLANVEAWAAINSGSRNLTGLAAVADAIGVAFSVLPGELRRVDPASVEAVDALGRVYNLPHGQHLHLKVRPDAPLQILLTGHMDTVFAADHPFQALTWLDAGTLGGPGVADMKGGIAVMLAALEAIEASPAASGIGYEVVLNSDEEVGSLASAPLIAEAARGKRAALTFEPSALPDGTLAGARPGSGNFSFTVRGKSAHAGRNPEDGRNALLAAADLALRLAKGVGPALSINPAKIDGGGPNNVVPDLAVLRVNLRPATIDDQARAQSLIEAAVAMVAAEHDVAIDSHGHFARPPKPMTPELEALFGVVKQAGADLGQTIGWQPTGGVCDGNNIAACGVPVIDTMGVRGGNIHSMEEYLIVESLGERAALAALTLLRLAAGR